MLQELVQQIEETARSVIGEVHTALPGEIIRFDPDKGTADVQPKGKYLTDDGKRLEYPVITEVPVTFPFCQTESVGMAFPVSKGDNCLIIVSEVELDEWRSGAESEAPLRFDLTSAIAVPGLLLGNVGMVSRACKQKAAIVWSGGTEIAVSKSGIACRGNMTVEGTLTCTGEVTSGGIGLQGHTHISAPPGASTSKSQ